MSVIWNSGVKGFECIDVHGDYGLDIQNYHKCLRLRGVH